MTRTKRLRRVALLAAINYETLKSFSRLHWPCADMASLGRLLVGRCGFDRVIVLNQRPAPYFSEGHLPDLARIVARLRPGSSDCPRLVDSIFAHAKLNAEEIREFERFEDTALGRERIEGLLVFALNEFLRETGVTREALREHIPELPTIDVPVVSGPEGCGLEFGGPPTRAALLDAAQLLVSELRDEDLFLFGFAGHGFDDGGASFMVLPDADGCRSFTRASSLCLADLSRGSGLQVNLADVCRTQFGHLATLGGRSAGEERRSQGAEGVRNVVGGGVRAGATPRNGAMAMLQACWQGDQAFETRSFRHGRFTRLLIEALQGGGVEGQATFDSVARYVGREMQVHCDAVADQLGSDVERQQVYVHWSGLAVPIVLGQNPEPIRGDARLWAGVPRWDGMVPGHEFRLNSLGLPFVRARRVSGGVPHDFLVAVYPVRVGDFRVYLRETQPALETRIPEGNESLPVVRITYAEAKAFAVWLTKRDQRRGHLPPGFAYDLLTDAEWDAVAGLRHDASCPSPRLHSRFSAVHPCAQGIVPAGFQYGPAEGPIPVDCAAPLEGFAEFRPVAGVLGLAGNVWELCETVFDPSTDSQSRTLRGQSWKTPLAEANLVARGSLHPSERRDDVGFRLVLRGR